jgi:hypothetical protein
VRFPLTFICWYVRSEISITFAIESYFRHAIHIFSCQIPLWCQQFWTGVQSSYTMLSFELESDSIVIPSESESSVFPPHKFWWAISCFSPSCKRNMNWGLQILLPKQMFVDVLLL